MAGQPIKMSNEKVSEFREAFMLFDYNKTGRVSARDIGPIVRSVGLKPTEAEIHTIANTVQQMGGDVDLATCMELVTAHCTNPPNERPEVYREMFSIYDKDNRGTISVAEMRHLLTSVGEKLTDEEADQLLKVSGCVQNGQVQYDKFIQVVLKG